MVRNFEAHTFTVWCFEKFCVTTFTNQGSVPVATDIKEAFLDLNFHSSWAIHENHKHCKPRKFFAIQYPPCVAYLCQLCQVNESTETLGLLQLDYTQHIVASCIILLNRPNGLTMTHLIKTRVLLIETITVFAIQHAVTTCMHMFVYVHTNIHNLNHVLNT